MRTALLVTLLALPGALEAHAQNQAQTLPGSPHLDDTRLTPGSWETEVVMKRDGREMPGGTTRYALSRMPDGNWMLVSSTTSQLGTATDTTVVEKGTLRPLFHRSHAVPRDLALDFDGTRVTGAYTARDSAARAIDHTTEVPVFDSSFLEVLLGALPLAADYATRVPFFVQEQGGLTWADVQVLGDSVVAGTPVWSVRMGLAGYDVTYFLGRDDHLPRGGTIAYPNGAVVEMRRTGGGRP